MMEKVIQFVLEKEIFVLKLRIANNITKNRKKKQKEKKLFGMKDIMMMTYKRRI